MCPSGSRYDSLPEFEADRLDGETCQPACILRLLSFSSRLSLGAYMYGFHPFSIDSMPESMPDQVMSSAPRSTLRSFSDSSACLRLTRLKTMMETHTMTMKRSVPRTEATMIPILFVELDDGEDCNVCSVFSVPL